MDALVLSVALLSADPTPPPSAQAAWLWAQATIPVKQPVCPNPATNAAWLWTVASIPVIHPTDLPQPSGSCPCGPDCSCGGGCKCKCSQADCYNQLREKAIKEKIPLVVGVGVDTPKLIGVLTCRWDKFPGVKEGIVIGVPSGNDLTIAATLSIKATAKDITQAAKPKPATQPTFVKPAMLTGY